MLEPQERSFRHINNWTSESFKKFANRLAVILAITEDMRHKYKSNSSKSVGYDVECDPIRIHCLNKRGEWIGISNCLSYRKSTLDIFANEDWDDLHRDRGCPTFYSLHDLESHWRYPIFRGGLHFEPLDINELQLHVTVRRQAFFPFSPHSEYSAFLNRLQEAEHWLLEQLSVPEELKGFDTAPPEFSVYVMQNKYSEAYGVDDVLIELGDFQLRDLQSGLLMKRRLDSPPLVPTHGFLDSLFMHKLLKMDIYHKLEEADMIWVEVENKLIWKSYINQPFSG